MCLESPPSFSLISSWDLVPPTLLMLVTTDILSTKIRRTDFKNAFRAYMERVECALLLVPTACTLPLTKCSPPHVSQLLFGDLTGSSYYYCRFFDHHTKSCLASLGSPVSSWTLFSVVTKKITQNITYDQTPTVQGELSNGVVGGNPPSILRIS